MNIDTHKIRRGIRTGGYCTFWEILKALGFLLDNSPLPPQCAVLFPGSRQGKELITGKQMIQHELPEAVNVPLWIQHCLRWSHLPAGWMHSQPMSGDQVREVTSGQVQCTPGGTLLAPRESILHRNHPPKMLSPKFLTQQNRKMTLNILCKVYLARNIQIKSIKA